MKFIFDRRLFDMMQSMLAVALAAPLPAALPTIPGPDVTLTLAESVPPTNASALLGKRLTIGGHKVTMYEPAGAGPFPVMIWFHCMTNLCTYNRVINKMVKENVVVRRAAQAHHPPRAAREQLRWRAGAAADGLRQRVRAAEGCLAQLGGAHRQRPAHRRRRAAKGGPCQRGHRWPLGAPPRTRRPRAWRVRASLL